MPLIIFVGGPCSGKTTHAHKLQDYLKSKNEECIVINEESLGLNKIEYYENFQSEKNLRAKLKSEVEKQLNDKKIIILDYMNYVKGYRYELYCLVRNMKTRQCVIHLNIGYEKCLENNKHENLYKEDLLDDLYKRMEDPIAKNRWDSPLIQVYFNEELPYEEIHTFVISGKRPNYAISTNTEIQVNSSFLQEIEEVCKEVNNSILSHQTGGIINSIKFEEYNLYLKKVFSGVELKNIKNEYIKLCKIHPPKNKENLKRSYIDYINSVQERF